MSNLVSLQYFSACACTEGDRTTKLAAMACVLNTLTQLQENTRLQPDSYTWPAIWKACENLLDTEQDIQRINMVFDLCVRNGAISELVFNNIRNFLPPQYLQKKLNTTGNIKQLTVRDLPSEWTCNVKLRRIRNKPWYSKIIRKRCLKHTWRRCFFSVPEFILLALHSSTNKIKEDKGKGW